MPATFSTSFSNPKIERMLREQLDQFCKQYPDGWRVSILGAQNNDIWELKVIADDGRTVWVHSLHGTDGEHDIEKIVAALAKSKVEIFRTIAR